MCCSDINTTPSRYLLSTHPHHSRPIYTPRTPPFPLIQCGNTALSHVPPTPMLTISSLRRQRRPYDLVSKPRTSQRPTTPSLSPQHGGRVLQSTATPRHRTISHPERHLPVVRTAGLPMYLTILSHRRPSREFDRLTSTDKQDNVAGIVSTSQTSQCVE